MLKYQSNKYYPHELKELIAQMPVTFFPTNTIYPVFSKS